MSMIRAWLGGKLSREQENLEDLLTSTVFGLLQYVPESDGLLPFLAKARDREGRDPLSSLAKGTRAEYLFWPRWDEKGGTVCEPDLLIQIENDDTRVDVIVEVKFRSGKSGGGGAVHGRPSDQLAREWAAWWAWPERTAKSGILVYLTADFAIPRGELSQSSEDAGRIEGLPPLEPCWLSWRQLRDVVPEEGEEKGGASERILADIRRLLDRLDLSLFRGIRSIEGVGEINWSYREELRVRAVPEVGPIDWRFRA
jgi:hypothetical protein